MHTFKKDITKVLISCFLLTATTGVSLAQITIGSLNAPVNGALLDLKEEDQLGFNSTKGLLMPRVNLTSLTNLYPMFAGDTDYSGNISNKRTDENAKHIGLVVYNTNSCLNLSGKDNGVYIWDGNRWQSISPQPLSGAVSIFVDPRDAKQYRYRSFGNAGVWMLDNMRALAYDTNSGANPENITINLTGVASQTEADGLLNSAPRIAYPQYSLDTYNTYPQLGIRYSWVVATGRNAPLVTPASEGTGDAAQLNVGPQGICPNGWHVPSDLEWNKLEEEIYNNAQLYSNYTAANRNFFDPLAWQPGFNTTASQLLRGSSDNTYGHALAMFNSCLVQNNATIVSNTAVGRSLSPEEGGLNVFLVFGDYNELNKVGLYWTASYSGSAGNNNGNAYCRYLYFAGSSKTRRVNPTTKNLLYVRCKQDGT